MIIDPPEPLHLAGHEVRALSIGGLETCIDLPGFGVAFDIGRCPHWVVGRKTVLLTHPHIDHLGGIASHAATRTLLHMPPPLYVVPPKVGAPLRRLFDAWRELDASELNHDLVELPPGEDLELKRDLVVRPFRTFHTAPSQGYGLWRVRRKLLPEYAGLPSEEIGRLRTEEGREVTEEVRVPEVAFVGDTRIDVVDTEEVVRRARLLILEVTFVDDRVSVESAREMGHVHLDEVLERADFFENEAILFTHFSARYKRSDIVRTLERRLPPGLAERVTPLLSGHPGGS